MASRSVKVELDCRVWLVVLSAEFLVEESAAWARPRVALNSSTEP